MKKVILILIGSISLILGVVGIIVPLLPTTPLVLFASICFSKSSDKIYNKFKKNKYFNDIIESYVHKKGLKRSTKIYTLIFLWIPIITSTIIIRKLSITLMLITISSLVTIHLLTIENT